jgi:hypothetical protein
MDGSQVPDLARGLIRRRDLASQKGFGVSGQSIIPCARELMGDNNIRHIAVEAASGARGYQPNSRSAVNSLVSSFEPRCRDRAGSRCAWLPGLCR